MSAISETRESETKTALASTTPQTPAPQTPTQQQTPTLVTSGSLADAEAAFAALPASGPLCWGPLQWMTLHQLLRGYPTAPTQAHKDALKAYTGALASLIPCGFCASHWAQLAPTVDTSSRVAAIKWGVDVHNTVNARLKKPVLSYAAAAQAMADACPHNGSPVLIPAAHQARNKVSGIMLIVVTVLAVGAIVALAVVLGRRCRGRAADTRPWGRVPRGAPHNTWLSE